MFRTLFFRLLNYLSNLIDSKKLVFNCTWEDPDLDKEALQISEKDNLICITSAGCNILNYLLEKPNHIYAIDINPCQNALLQLKIASIREFDYSTYWQMWGHGKIQGFSQNIYPRLRKYLSKEAKDFWDSHKYYFDVRLFRNSFYWHGSSGLFAYFLRCYLSLVGLFNTIDQLFKAQTIEEQKFIYEKFVMKTFWNPLIRIFLSSSWILSCLNGVPLLQQHLMTKPIPQFLKDSFHTLCSQISIKNNYFYRVYIFGEYTKDCCPEYLKEDNFLLLKNGLIDRISLHTTTITQFLQEYQPKENNKFILLDHMDWIANQQKVLSEEWEEIIQHSNENSIYIWRSVSSNSNFIDQTQIIYQGKQTKLKDLITYQEDLAARLHQIDRVHTYVSFFIAHFNHSILHK